MVLPFEEGNSCCSLEKSEALDGQIQRKGGSKKRRQKLMDS